MRQATQTSYNRAVADIQAQLQIKSASIRNNLEALENALDSTQPYITDHEASIAGIERKNFIRQFDDSVVSTGTNSITVGGGGITLCEVDPTSGDITERTGWASSGALDATGITSGVVWAIYPGLTYSITNNDPANKPANGYRILTFTNTAGTVTVNEKSWQNCIESQDLILEEDLLVNKTSVFKGATSFSGSVAFAVPPTGLPTPAHSIKTSTPYTVTTVDEILEWNGTANGTFNLYTASGNAGRNLTIKNITTTYNLTLDGNSSETIDGNSTVVVYPGEIIEIYSDGTNWRTKNLTYISSGLLLPSYACRAWVNFDGTTAANVTGTYSRTGTTVTVSVSGHNHKVGHQVYADFTSGTAVDGTFTVTTVADANTFTFEHGTSGSTSGNITLNRRAIRGGANISNIAYIAVGDYRINFTNAMPDINYNVLPAASTPLTFIRYSNVNQTGSSATDTAPTVNSFALITADSIPSRNDSKYVNISVFR